VGSGWARGPGGGRACGWDPPAGLGRARRDRGIRRTQRPRGVGSAGPRARQRRPAASQELRRPPATRTNEGRQAQGRPAREHPPPPTPAVQAPLTPTASVGFLLLLLLLRPRSLTGPRNPQQFSADGRRREEARVRMLAAQLSGGGGAHSSFIGPWR
jgi:hypothetical protein